jgi:hypothetical protein
MRKAIALPFVLASLLGWGCSSSAPASSSCPKYQVSNGSGQCVQCVTDADCATSPEGQACLGDGLCGCSSPADCAANPSGSACLATSVCGCNADTDCNGAMASCNTMSNLCTPL